MIIPVETPGGNYNIIIERGSLEKISDFIPCENRRALIVTDSGVPEEYAKTVKAALKNAEVFVFPQGEESKNFDTYKSVCSKLTELSFTRKDIVVALGGGVVGDMAGFAAATYMRGVDFYNIPTTVLSQVDSSVGGKTAVDLDGIKNIIGAFYQPKCVVIDPNVLSTLSSRMISNGLAESLKMGITGDEELVKLLEKDDYLSNIEKIIERSVLYKRSIVQQDEKEAGLRRVLNFGHTLGHAIESAVGLGSLYHGECVGLGLVPMCGEDIRGRVVNALKNLGLPTSFDYDKDKAFSFLLHDKKSAGGDSVTVVKCDNIGSFRFETVKAQSLYSLL